MIYAIKTDDNKTVATMDYVRNAQVLYDKLQKISASEAKSRLKLLLEVRA